MSKSLSLLVFLKRQKKDPNGKMPLYIRVNKLEIAEPQKIEK
jgi:hypothetical protein